MSVGFNMGVAFLLKEEGGYAADLGDGAGETNFGITARSYPGISIKALSEEEARAIYLRDYYTAINLDALPVPLAIAMLDAAANHGPQTAIRLLQESLGVPQDGVIGPVTAAAAKAQSDALLKFCLARVMRYAQSGNFQKFGRTWVKRVLSCYRYAAAAA